MSENILPLASNGAVFVDPLCMRGVPVARVLEGDPYWVESWISFDELLKKMEGRLVAYELEILQGANPERLMEPIYTLVGLKEYFDEEGFHPNQLLGKKHITGTGLVQIDLLYKIKGIMEALHEAYQVDVIKTTPLSWIRARLAYILDKQKSAKSLQVILETFDEDAEFESVLNVCDMILRPPGHVRGPLQTKKIKRRHKTTFPAEQISKPNNPQVPKSAKKAEFRQLHRKTYIRAAVNRYLKQQYKAYQESQKRAEKPLQEENTVEESETEVDDDSEYVD